MNTVEQAFTAYLGRQPTDKERQRLMRGRDAAGIKDNDALWTLLMVLEHYETLYERFPALIAKAASDVTDNARAAAEVELKAAAARTRTELARTVSQTALDIAARVANTKRAKWFSMSFGLAATLFAGVAVGMYRLGVSSGVASGRLDGYTMARDEKAAAAWANTFEGQLAYALGKAGGLRDLATCSGRALVRRGTACFVRIGPEATFGWRLSP